MTTPRWDADTETCWGSCGSLSWTRERYGRLTHKHSCSIRVDGFCQSHDACSAAPEHESWCYRRHTGDCIEGPYDPFAIAREYERDKP